MNRNEHLLVTLAEECGEVAYEVSKALRFGLDDHNPYDLKQLSNRDRIVREFREAMIVYDMCVAEGLLPFRELPPDVVRDKVDRVERFMAYAEEKGTLYAVLNEVYSPGEEGRQIGEPHPGRDPVSEHCAKLKRGGQ